MGERNIEYRWCICTYTMVLIGSNCAPAVVHLLVTYCARVTSAHIIVAADRYALRCTRKLYDFYERIENTRKMRHGQNPEMTMEKQSLF